jgi:hypothetical protein
MKKRLYLMLLISVVLLQSCAGSHKIKTTAVPSLMQKVDYNGAVVSEKKHIVSLTHYKEFKHVKNKIIFDFLVQNRGRKPLSINNENISMEFRGKDEGSAPIKLEIQPLDDFIKDLENDYFNEDIRIISSMFTNIENTAWRIKSIPSTDRVSAKNIATMFASSFLSSADDLEETIRVYDQLEEIVPPLVFKPQTIMPGPSVTRLIVYDTGAIDEKAEGEFKLIIRVEGEEHKFVFSRSM